MKTFEGEAYETHIWLVGRDSNPLIGLRSLSVNSGVHDLSCCLPMMVEGVGVAPTEAVKANRFTVYPRPLRDYPSIIKLRYILVKSTVRLMGVLMLPAVSLARSLMACFRQLDVYILTSIFFYSITFIIRPYGVSHS